MKSAMTIIFFAILLFDLFMATPFGVMWTFDNLEEGKPCYGILIMAVTMIPLMFIGCYLGLIQ